MWIKMTKYDRLLKTLHENRYEITIHPNDSFLDNGYSIYTFKKKNVCGVISTNSKGECIGIWHNCICADIDDLFNKWSQSPVQLEIKDSEEFRLAVIMELEKLNESYELVDNGDYELSYAKDYDVWKCRGVE